MKSLLEEEEKRKKSNHYKEYNGNRYVPSKITLHVNGLNVAIKKHRVLEYIKTKTHMYAVYKRPTSEQK